MSAIISDAPRVYYYHCYTAFEDALAAAKADRECFAAGGFYLYDANKKYSEGTWNMPFYYSPLAHQGERDLKKVLSAPVIARYVRHNGFWLRDDAVLQMSWDAEVSSR